uniref:glycosyltransferase WbsX family protein n=1 Tax=Algoriphagus sp. TaxID=1872435 RepID=UPI0025882AEC|nr:glycoside hydrolase family 99-like domain-containing protein [Algoriphagus sp.]
MTKIFAFYLPQFHQIPENDSWWGEGFTEWTNVKKAKPLFSGHQQPLIPGELGYYNLETSETMKKQAKLAKDYGIDGFVFYHYWFGNAKTLLEKPILNFLNDSSIDIQFCICWANESWKGTWHGAAKNQLLQEQKYLGREDYKKHFQFLLPFFKDFRSLKINDKPVFQIYVPESIPDLDVYIETFNDLAKVNGLKGIYWMGVKSSDDFDPATFGIQGLVNVNLKSINRYHHKTLKGLVYRYLFSNPLIRKIAKWPKRIPYRVVRYCMEDFRASYSFDFYPLAVPNWDNTPRVKNEGTVYVGASPKAFRDHLKACLKQAKKNGDSEKNLVFIKSWNEWAEGNMLEPEAKYGLEYLEAVKEVKSE